MTGGLIGYGEVRFTSTDFNGYVVASTAEGSPQRDQGFMAAAPFRVLASLRK